MLHLGNLEHSYASFFLLNIIFQLGCVCGATCARPSVRACLCMSVRVVCALRRLGWASHAARQHWRSRVKLNCLLVSRKMKINFVFLFVIVVVVVRVVVVVVVVFPALVCVPARVDRSNAAVT